MAGAVMIEETDAATGERAQRIPEEGTDLARAAGLDAKPRTCPMETTTAEAILSEAQTVGARTIGMGSRAVIVVPSPKVVATRTPRPSHDPRIH